MLIAAIFLWFRLCSAATASTCGSGFVIQENGYILTNYHVIKNANRITVTVPGRQAISVRVVAGDEEKDLGRITIKSGPRGDINC
jgi:S1-C subfamily serine protease